MTPTHVLLTHHHYDHVVALGELLERWPDMEVLIHPAERDLVEAATGDLIPGETLRDRRRSTSRSLHTPGHTAGMLALLVDGQVFTGDTLFKGSVGGVRAPGQHELRGPEVVDHGRAGDAAAGDGRAPRPHRPDDDRRRAARPTRSSASGAASTPRATGPCTALGEPATLVLLGDDYDGGHKAWVRWPDGRDDIVPGSQVQPG